jgi:essential nuclear protein 1
MSATATRNANGPTSYRHQAPLADELITTAPLKNKSKKRKARRDDEGEGYVDSKSSRKILKIGQELVEEDQENSKSGVPNSAFTFESRFDASSEASEDEPYDDQDDAWADEEEEIVEEIVRIYR